MHLDLSELSHLAPIFRELFKGYHVSRRDPELYAQLSNFQDQYRTLFKALGFELVATKGTAAAIEAAGVPVQVVNKVTEGRPHIVDMIKNNEIVMVINTVEERRNAIADSRAIRTSSLLARVTTFTTIFGAEAAVEGMKYLDKLDVYSVQELHAQLAA